MCIIALWKRVRLGHSATLKEECRGIKFVLKKILHHDHKWPLSSLVRKLELTEKSRI